MRSLIYVPIIHVSADLGDISSEVTKKGLILVGEENWKRHGEIVFGFWDSIANYFESIDVKNFKIYQDGLMINGEVGLKIVSDGMKKGSKNFEIVSQLVSRGAQLVKTEDYPLVRKEYDYLVKITRAKKPMQKIRAALNYKFHKKKLLTERDKFIAKVINTTLGQQETGVLFLGAHHEITSKLYPDIKIIELKKREKIKEYQKKFLKKRDKGNLNKLANYLISPIE